MPRVIVWGTGSIGSRHAGVLRELLGKEPILVPVRKERVSELRVRGWQAAEWRQAAVAGGAVIICTDTGRHREDVLAALTLGCDVLCEKPLAASVTGLSAVYRAAESHRRQVFVACNLRFDAGLGLFRNRLAEVGRVHAVRIECQSYLPEWRQGTDYRRAYSARAEEGGVLRDLIHEIDYATWLFGRPERVTARLGNTGLLGIESEEWAELWWRAPAGMQISVYLDYLTRAPRRRMSAFGEQGEIEWDARAQHVRIAVAGKQEEIVATPQERNEQVAAQARAFLAAVQGHDRGDLATLDDGGFTVALCDAARRASLSGKEEPIADWRQA